MGDLMEMFEILRRHRLHLNAKSVLLVWELVSFSGT